MSVQITRGAHRQVIDLSKHPQDGRIVQTVNALVGGPAGLAQTPRRRSGFLPSIRPSQVASDAAESDRLSQRQRRVCPNVRTLDSHNKLQCLDWAVPAGGLELVSGAAGRALTPPTMQGLSAQFGCVL